MFINVIGATTRESARGSEVKTIKFDTEKQEYIDTTGNDVTEEMVMRFFKGAYSNKERFKARLLDKNREFAKVQLEDDRLSFGEKEYNELMAWFDRVESIFDNYKPFTYKEAWELKSDDFKMAVFGTIDLSEMLEELGGVRYKTDGKVTVNRKYDENGKYLGEYENNNIYELYKVSGEKLGMPNEEFHIIKCWCTSTNEEHLIWIDDEYKDDPFKAISATFEVHENILPYIKCLKRQGDLLLVEMNDEYETSGVKPEGNKVRLTDEQYFGMMVAQS